MEKEQRFWKEKQIYLEKEKWQKQWKQIYSEKYIYKYKYKFRDGGKKN